ncbi:hypothetical protein DFH11DRAFT_1734642 [Phellopilus nigrolimitatus]|nr:hypothetical protein DFH11DRAFT_1734642 [Phellopilus nigrolimitatus]
MPRPLQQQQQQSNLAASRCAGRSRADEPKLLEEVEREGWINQRPSARTHAPSPGPLIYLSVAILYAGLRRTR